MNRTPFVSLSKQQVLLLPLKKRSPSICSHLQMRLLLHLAFHHHHHLCRHGCPLRTDICWSPLWRRPAARQMGRESMNSTAPYCCCCRCYSPLRHRHPKTFPTGHGPFSSVRHSNGTDGDVLRHRNSPCSWNSTEQTWTRTWTTTKTTRPTLTTCPCTYRDLLSWALCLSPFRASPCTPSRTTRRWNQIHRCLRTY